MELTGSRYPFAEIAEGVFFFVTDAGIYYTVEISNSSFRFNQSPLLFNKGNIFEISFFPDKSNTSKQSKKHDEIVCNTILHILSSNINSRGDTAIFYFVCDTSDGIQKGKFRARLFDLWHLRLLKYMPYLKKNDFIVSGFEEDEYCVSLLLSAQHPSYNEYVNEFAKSLEENFNKQ